MIEEAFDKLKDQWGLTDNPMAKSIFQAGANWQKEQMMKDAVEGVVTLDYWDAEDREIDVVLADNVIGEEHGIKDGDKVKLIIIKEIGV